MAYTKAQLLNIMNTNLASNIAIKASQHRTIETAVIEEMYDAQSRGNLLAAVQAATTVEIVDELLLVREGQAYLIPASDIAGGVNNLVDLEDVLIIPSGLSDTVESIVYYNPITEAFEAKTLSEFTISYNATAVRDALESLTDDDRLDASAIKNLPSDTAVQSVNEIEPVGGDVTLTTDDIPEAGGNLYTNLTEKATWDSKFDSGAQVRDALQALSGADRLDASAIKNLGPVTTHFKGSFVSLAALEAAVPTAEPGDYALVDPGVGTDAVKYIWDDSDSAWVAGGGSGASTFADLTGDPMDNPALADEFDGKQNALGYTPQNIAAKDANSGYAGLDAAGNVTKVWTTLLTGLSLAVGTAITAGDTILAAFGKLQKQITDLLAAIPSVLSEAEANAGTDNLKYYTALRWFQKAKAKTTTTAAFTVDATNDLKSIIATPSGPINATINTAATDVVVVVENYGSGTITFVNGTATFVGISSLLPNKAAKIRYTAAGTAVIIGGSTITFANVTAKPTTVSGYGITDASKSIFATGSTVTSAGTTETTLATGNIPANTLPTDLGHLRAVFVGQIGASAPNKTIKVKLGATTIFDSGLIPIAGAVDFEIQIKIMRTASNAQRGSVTLYSNSGTVAGMKYFTATEDLTTLLALAVTGTVASPGGTEMSGNMFYAVKEGI